jgi:NitT/TauT family transport system ATP-binding protein
VDASVLVSLKAIGKTYLDAKRPVTVFDGLNLDLLANEIVAVLGPTGCGKSTLLGFINGLVLPSQGSVTFGRTRTTFRIGTKPQKDLLLPWRTVRANARLAREIVNNVEIGEDSVTEILRTLGLLDYQDLHPDQLSGGMRQKLALARTLLLDPDLLLLDEPFANIDFHQKLDLEKLCSQWIREKGRAALIVTHDVEQAVAVADRLIVLNGRPANIALDLRLDYAGKERDPWRRRKDAAFFQFVEKALAALRP